MQPHSHPNPVDNLGHPELAREICLSSDADCCNVCTRLDHLDEEIARAQAIVQDLLRQRDGFRSQLNQVHPSIVHRFPVEVASTIFEVYASNADGKESPFTLGAVCQRWRDIAWSTPKIWATLTLSGLRARRALSETRVQLVDDWLGRSARQPLFITLHFSSLNDDRPQFHRLIDVINQHCDHWYSLDLQLPSVLLIRFNDAACDSSTLYKLSMWRSSFSGPDLTIGTLRRIAPRILCMHSISLDIGAINWTHITHLTLGVLSVDETLQIFRMSPSLYECRFDSIYLREAGSQTESQIPIVHAILESLHIRFSFSDPRAAECFFNNVTLPTLKYLDVHGSGDEYHGCILVPFLMRSSNGLQNLLIDEDNYPGEDLVRIARLTPSLERLCIRQLDLFYDALTSHLPDPDSPLSATVDPLLPSLRIFEWIGDGSSLGKFKDQIQFSFTVGLDNCLHDDRGPAISS
ncbi:hypothetical protein CPB84DRAFT_1807269 [Gymnopilus junonius]|uniref:F-box domain-containing protein n=1 Tax=Gymnopilus junonius TaxID=109634 RepID=A0A9P5N6L5_GYMJU|nr:hypothetical protein CPB84DRAFT_1807269 [Gymnopilus junonius]